MIAQVLVFAALTLVLGTQEAQAQTRSQTYKGVVQFTAGDTKLKSGEETFNAEFQTLIRYGDEFTVDSESYVKIITLEKCVAVVYGPAVVKVPKDPAGSWKVENGSSRWICEGPGQLRISAGEAGEIQLNRAEIIWIENKLFVYKGQVKTKKGNALTNRVQYIGRATGWGRVAPQPGPTSLNDWDTQFPLPKESARKTEPAPAAPVKQPVYAQEKSSLKSETRFMLTPLYGASVLTTPKKEFSYESGVHAGGRLWFNPAADSNALLVTGEFVRSAPATQDVNGGLNTVEAVLAGVGKRWNHSRDFSFYSLLQTGFFYHSIEKNYTSYTVKRNRFYVPIGVTMGAQHFFFRWGSLRLFVAAEAFAQYGLWYVDQVQSDTNRPPEGYRINGAPLLYGGSILLGPALQF